MNPRPSSSPAGRGPSLPLPARAVPILALLLSLLAVPLPSNADWSAAAREYEQALDTRAFPAQTPQALSTPPGQSQVQALTPQLGARPDLLRIVAPVRFPAADPPPADSAKSLLAQYRRHGFTHALWAVSELLQDPNELAQWTKACLEAFEQPPVLAIDSGLRKGRVVPEPQSLEPFLKLVLPHVHSVLVNYRQLNNFTCGDEPAAMQVVRLNAALVRHLAPKTFLWLYLNDAPWFGPDNEAQWKSRSEELVKTFRTWADSLGQLPDGYYAYCQHPWTASTKPECIDQARLLLATGKPVLRAGLEYRSPRLRPGIEAALSDRYAKGMKKYEEWVLSAGFVGCSRYLGPEIPCKVASGISFLPAD